MWKDMSKTNMEKMKNGAAMPALTLVEWGHEL